MKKSRILAGAAAMMLAATFTLTACDDDKEEYTADLPTASTISVDVSSVEINDDNLEEKVCTFNYNATGTNILASDGTALGVGTYWLEYSKTESFDVVKRDECTPTTGSNTITLTGRELNTMAVKLGAEYDVAAPIYFRINHSYNNSTAELGVPSNVVTINVTPIKVIPTLNIVSKTDEKVIYATIVYNEETKLYEGAYESTEWNFYFVDPVEGIVYGCDNDYSKPEGENRSYKIVKDRKVGDDYSHWLDPANTPANIKVDLEKMEWSYERIATEKKDLTGVHVLLVGDDMGWNDPWDQITPAGTEVTANGDEYTVTFENVSLTTGSGFGFRATSPASAWIGKGGITVSEPIIEGENLGVSETGIYTLTFKAVAEADGSITYSLTAEKTGAADKKDLTGVHVLLVGADMGWQNNWNSEEAPTVTANGDEYTVTYENVKFTAGNGFGFRATSPAATWIGKDAFSSVSEPIVKGSDNLEMSETGYYTLTFKAIAEDDGSVTYSLSAQKVGDVTEADDFSDKKLGVKGDFGESEWTVNGAVTPTADGNVYTYTIENIEFSNGLEFGLDVDGNWIGKNDITLGSEDNLVTTGTNLAVSEAGTYNFKIVVTAEVGKNTYTLTVTKAE